VTEAIIENGPAPDIESKPQTKIRRWEIIYTFLVFVAICAFEYIFAYHNVAFGIGLSLGLVIIIYVSLSFLHFNKGIIKIIESLSLIPLYVIFTSSLPWFFINQQYLLPAVYSAILALCFWHMYRNDVNFKAVLNFNKRKLFLYILIAVAIGLPTGTIEYLILRPLPSSPSFSIPYFFRDIVYMVLFVGLAEELLFRGLIQTSFSETFGNSWALVITAALFSAMHLTWRSVPELGFVFVAGLIMGGLYIRTKSLVPSILFHGANNIVLVSIMPYILMK
jgi:uncharacterized protein